MSHLKNSLAKTLSRFYPLAGRMKGCATVDCDDSGVPFIVAHMSCRLNELLKNPPTDSMSDFVPFKTNCFQDNSKGLVGIQVTTFDCGGIVIGVCMHHRTTDANSMTNFVRSWADEAHMPKGDKINPDFTTASELFPPVDSLSKEMQKTLDNHTFKETKHVQRRYVFDMNAIASIQAKASNEALPKPSKNEALTSFIWKHMMEASRIITGSSFTSIASFTINLRPRFKPPLSSNSFGNLWWFSFGSCYLSLDGQTDLELSKLVEVVHLDSEFVDELQQPGVILELMQEMGSGNIENLKKFSFSNWCNLGHYNIDFGLGKPVWIAYAHKNDTLNNKCTFFMDSPSGIEIWMTAEEAEVSLLEKMPSFLEFATVNPSVQPY
nr:vinorine synthase-like [Tanacetum cinerariifolium]